MEKLYYCRESEKLWTLEEIKILYTVGTLTVWNIYTEV